METTPGPNIVSFFLFSAFDHSLLMNYRSHKGKTIAHTHRYPAIRWPNFQIREKLMQMSLRMYLLLAPIRSHVFKTQ